MSAILDLASGELPPTATYRLRMWTWIPADRAAAGWDGRAGTLRILLRHRRGTRLETDVYAIEEESPAVGVMGRSFLLLNLSDPDQADVYRVAIGHPIDVCSCTAGRVGRFECKHAAAMRAIIEEGGLEPTVRNDAPPPAEPCGYCGGRGMVGGQTHDRYGYEMPARNLTCEYCGGSGACEGGGKLLPAGRPALSEADIRSDRQ